MVTERSRGQLILVMAVLFAVTILTAVILLNTLHASADLNTRAQSSSLDAIEQTEKQVADDMERLFLVHTSMKRDGEALPYVSGTGGPDSDFDVVVGKYSELNAALVGSQSGTSVRVTYFPDDSQEGILVNQNDKQNFTYKGYDESTTNSWKVLKDTEELPRFVMNVTEGPDPSDNPFKVVVGSNTKLTFDDDGVDGSGVDCNGYPIWVNATDGVGTVSNESGVCGTVDLKSTDPSPDLTFEYGNNTEGTYTISGAGADSTGLEVQPSRAGQQSYDDVIVNPKFRLNYTSPGITHTANFTLYNETRP